MTNTPPKLARKILQSFLRDDLTEEVLGDLDEKFYYLVKNRSRFRAQLNYWYQVLNYMRPFAIRKAKSAKIISTIMFRHTLLISFRNFQRYKSSFFINLIGLSSGLVSVLLIYLWVTDELSFDTFHTKGDKLYQVMRNLEQGPNDIRTFDGNSDLLAPALAAEMPEVEHVVSVSRAFPNGILTVNDKSLKASGKFASRDFFQIFSYPLIVGTAERVFRDKYSIVISDDLAGKFFGSAVNAKGKSIAWDQKPYAGLYVVSGVFQSSGYNSSDKFDFLINNDVYLEHSNQYWDSNNVQTYLTLREDANVDEFNGKIKNFVKRKFKALYGSENLHFIATAFVRPYSDKYLYNRYENGVQSGGRIDNVILFSIVALFVLLIACVNFVNLSTARASRRFKEIGLKKAMGAFRRTLALQYLGESVIIAFFSIHLAMLVVFLLLPHFNVIAGKHLSLTFNLTFVAGILVALFVTGLLAGSYPALYLSGFKPVEILKGRLSTSFGEIWIRKGLVVFQFAISVLLMAGVVVVYKQIDFVQSKNLGYVKDNILTFRSDGTLNDHLSAFLTEIKDISGVVNTSTMGNDLGFPGGTGMVEWEGKNERVEFNVLEVGYDLVELLEIELKEGRAFSEKFSGDTSKLILNEMAVQSMGLTDPVGKAVKLWHQEYQVVGIAKNFHFESLYETIKPCIIRLIPPARNILVKIQPGAEKQTIERLEEKYHEYNAGVPFDFRFLDDDYQALYVSEKRVADLSLYFAIVAIMISCLGLFGLAAFTAERRQKEISIRKIFGLSEWGILSLLSKDFTKMVLTSMLISLPLTYVMARNWLNGFAYKIDLEWWYFGGVAMVALAMVWITVGLQLLKAARINPSQVLKNE